MCPINKGDIGDGHTTVGEPFYIAFAGEMGGIGGILLANWKDGAVQAFKLCFQCVGSLYSLCSLRRGGSGSICRRNIH